MTKPIEISLSDIESSRSITQTIVGLKLLYLMTQHQIKPFIGAGAGIAFGSMKQDAANGLGGEKSNFKPSFAYHFSGGILSNIKKLGFYINLNYKVISQALDKENETAYFRHVYDPVHGYKTSIISVAGLPTSNKKSGFNNIGICLGILINI